MALAVGVNPDESGLAMVRVADATGSEAVAPSTGAADEVFVGVSYLDKHASAKGVRVDYHSQIPSTGPFIVSVPDALIVGATLAVKDATGAPVAVVGVAGSAITFNAGDAGKDVYISYNYQLTEAQKQALGISPVPSAALFLGKIACLTGYQRVFVSNFDASKSYAVTGANSKISLGANGLFTLGGTGSVVGNCFHVPTAVDPWLGVEYTTGR
jgi:hypothetical protein